jgi:hypothetical protein
MLLYRSSVYNSSLSYIIYSRIYKSLLIIYYMIIISVLIDIIRLDSHFVFKD